MLSSATRTDGLVARGSSAGSTRVEGFGQQGRGCQPVVIERFARIDHIDLAVAHQVDLLEQADLTHHGPSVRAGGTSGIGLGVASAVAERGGISIVASRQQTSVDRALATLPGSARGMTVGLTDTTALDRLADEVGVIEHLGYTAGDSLEPAPLSALTPAVINGFLLVRFVGALTAIRVLAPQITPGGSITLTSGPAAERPGLGVLPTGVCGAVNAMTLALLLSSLRCA